MWHLNLPTRLAVGAILMMIQLCLAAPAAGTFMLANAPGAQFDFKPFELSNLCIDCSRASERELYSCTMKFKWYDANSANENPVSACNCSYSWKWDGETMSSGPLNSFESQAYSPCQISRPPATFFEMHIVDFHAVNNFTLALGRRYKDTKQFKPPAIYPTTFAEPIIKMGQGQRSERRMQFCEAGPVFAEIQGLTI